MSLVKISSVKKEVLLHPDVVLEVSASKGYLDKVSLTFQRKSEGILENPFEVYLTPESLKELAKKLSEISNSYPAQ